METTLVGTLTKAGSIHKVENGFIGLPSMNEPGTVAAIGDSLHNPEGSVMCAGFFEPELVAALRDTGKPLVLLDMRLPGYRSVNPDHALGGYLATRHLLALGRRRIAMLTGPLSHHSISERYRGFRKALFEARMLADPDLEIQLPSIGDTQDNLHVAVDTLLAREPRPDALFCYNDSAALAAMRCSQGEVGETVRL